MSEPITVAEKIQELRHCMERVLLLQRKLGLPDVSDIQLVIEELQKLRVKVEEMQAKLKMEEGLR